MKISPPTASKQLQEFHKEGLLKKEEDKQYIYYFANGDSDFFIDFSRIYWKKFLQDSGLVKRLEDEFLNPIIILFGSLSKGEAKRDSDIDIAIFTSTKKQAKFEALEKRLKRKIQLFIFKNRDDVKNPELLNNLLNGYKI